MADPDTAFLLAHVPAQARVVLELGCGAGGLAAALRRRNPAVRHFGVERDPGRAGRARPHLTGLACVGAEENALPFAGERFDCIVWRVAPYDPVALLRVQALALAPGGVFVLRGRAAEDLRPAILRAGLAPGEPVAAGEWVVWTAMAAPAPAVLVVSTMLAPVGGVSELRVAQPLRALASVPGVRTGLDGRVPAGVAEDAARLLVFHRPAFVGAAGAATAVAARDQGYVTICEFDDHPDHIPVLRGRDVFNFNALHAVQTSTQALADVLRPENDEIRVFPNAIPALPEVVNFRDPGRLTLFCAGINRDDDWSAVLPALNAVARQVGERLHFRIVNSRALFAQLQTAHKSETPLCGYDEYRRLLSGAEIACMPLRDNAFNRCKSDLKFIEAAASRVTAVASRVVYGDSIADGRTGLLFGNGAELEAHLLALLRDPASARRLADAGRAYVARHRMLDGQVARRLRWYRSLWAGRGALAEAAEARVPGG